MKSSKTLRVTLAGLAVTGLTAMSSPYVFAQEGGEGAGPGEGETTSPENQPEGTGTSQETPDLTKIPAKAKLEVTKLTPDDATPNSTPDGTKENVANQAKRGIQGVTFTAYKVEGIDLSTNEGWVKANEAAAAWQKLTRAEKEAATKIDVIDPETKEVKATYPISATKNPVGVTDVNGVATSGQLDRAFYVVKETIEGDTVTIDGKKVPAGKIVKADPFVVAVPMTDQDNLGKWLDTVRVYPKNSVQEAEKSLKDDETPGTGNDNTEAGERQSKIKYNIGAPVADKTKYSNFEIVDPLDERVVADVDHVTVSFEPSTKTMEKGVDYEVTVTPATDGNNTPSEAMAAAGMKKVGSILRVNFTESGLKKLNDGITKVNVDFEVQVKDTVGTTNIPNEGHVFPNEPYNPNKPMEDPEQPPSIPTNKVVSKYGKVTLTKISSEDGTKLQGAKFELFECNKAKELGKQVMVDNLSDWTTNNEGVLTIDGLQLNDFKNNSEGPTVEDATAAGQQTPKWVDDHFYCLVETEAPAGYEKLVEPIQFQLLQGANKADLSLAKYETDLEVKNVPNNGGFDLPLTGGKGVVPLIALGGLLVLGAGGYAAVAARRNRNEG